MAEERGPEGQGGPARLAARAPPHLEVPASLRRHAQGKPACPTLALRDTACLRISAGRALAPATPFHRPHLSATLSLCFTRAERKTNITVAWLLLNMPGQILSAVRTPRPRSTFPGEHPHGAHHTTRRLLACIRPPPSERAATANNATWHCFFASCRLLLVAGSAFAANSALMPCSRRLDAPFFFLSSAMLHRSLPPPFPPAPGAAALQGRQGRNQQGRLINAFKMRNRVKIRTGAVPCCAKASRLGRRETGNQQHSVQLLHLSASD